MYGVYLQTFWDLLYAGHCIFFDFLDMVIYTYDV